jgi:Fic family protein
MGINKTKGGMPGKHILTANGHRAYIPDNLPPKMELSPSIRVLLEEAAHLLGQVDMCRTLVPNRDLLVYSSLQREAIASSTIEGTITTPDELVLFQAGQNQGSATAREVANYAVALEWGLEQLNTLPISTRLILGLHERLMSGVRGDVTAGQFKTHQNYIANDQRTPIENATFVPAPPERVPDLIANIERYINNQGNEESRIVQCALVHYQFESIHPFRDGNGRVGRLLIILHLIQLGLLTHALIHPSVYFEHTRDEYYRLLQDVHERGTWEAWIRYFASGIIQQCNETKNFTQIVIQLQQRMRGELSAGDIDIRRHASIQAVLDSFFYMPVLNINEVITRTNLSYNAVKKGLNFLAERQVLAPIAGSRPRAYRCDAILHAIFNRTG